MLGPMRIQVLRREHEGQRENARGCGDETRGCRGWCRIGDLTSSLHWESGRTLMRETIDDRSMEMWSWNNIS